MSRNEKVALVIGGVAVAGITIYALSQTKTVAGTGTVAIGSTPTGVSFTINGASGTTPFSQNYNTGTSLTITMPATISVGADMYAFQSWSDGDTNPVRQVVVGTPPNNLSANYQCTTCGILTALSLSASTLSAAIGEIITFMGVLTDQATNAGIANQTVIVESSADQLVWSTMATLMTAADGSFATQGSFTVAGTYYIRARFAGA